MKVVALSVKGQEFLYKASTAHKVAEEKAQKVADALNEVKYKLDGNYVWYVHDVDQYDDAYYYAEAQRFTYGKNGAIKRIA